MKASKIKIRFARKTGINIPSLIISVSPLKSLSKMHKYGYVRGVKSATSGTVKLFLESSVHQHTYLSIYTSGHLHK